MDVAGHMVSSTHFATFRKDLLPSASEFILMFLLTHNYVQQVSVTRLNDVISQRLIFSVTSLTIQCLVRYYFFSSFLSPPPYTLCFFILLYLPLFLFISVLSYSHISLPSFLHP
jgi:hypothetical protein